MIAQSDQITGRLGKDSTGLEQRVAKLLETQRQLEAELMGLWVQHPDLRPDIAKLYNKYAYLKRPRNFRYYL